MPSTSEKRPYSGSVLATSEKRPFSGSVLATSEKRPLSRSIRVVRYVLATVNVIILLVGCVLTAVGVTLLLNVHKVEFIVHIIDISVFDINLLETSAGMLIGVGVVIIILGFFGCCGLFMFQVMMLQIYTLMMFALLLCEIIAGILGIIFHGQVNSTIELLMLTNMKAFYGVRNETTLAWNVMQFFFQCCGTRSYEDYAGSAFEAQIIMENPLLENLTLISPACCNIQEITFEECLEAVNLGVDDEEIYYREGCFSKFRAWILQKALLLILSAFLLTSFQFFAIAVICWMLRDDAKILDWVCVCL